ncbi:MAG TPA: hypothetical protein VKS43_10755 [Burkholderiales bacterium]|nr:hypothetical protein [Burkholderiales bacterium]
MKSLAAAMLALVLSSALAQPGPRAHPMPPPERRMSWEDRQRLREQVRNGNMTREEARERWREERDQRTLERGRTPEEREKLRRDVQETNRDLERR